MTNTKTTKRALLASVLSIVICLTMLIGSTFAWFTDSATTGTNKITAGNLDVELYYSADKMSTWQDAEKVENIFTADKWEPGYTQVGYFKVKNAGSLALDFKVATNVVKEKEGKNQAGDTFKLSDYLQFGFVDGTTAFTDRKEARDAVATPNKFSNVGTNETRLTSGGEATFAIVVWMPEETTNVANHDGTNIPEIQFGINVIASQADVESDSFGIDYDENAKYPTQPELDAIVAQVGNATDLKNIIDTAFQNGGSGDITVTLTQNIDVNDQWDTFEIPNTSANITIDGAGYTISNLNKPLVTGLWGGWGTLTFKNLTIDSADITNFDAADVGGTVSASGAFMAYADAANKIVFDSCKLTNTTINSNSKYAGGFMGYSSLNAVEDLVFNKCSISNITINGAESTGGFVGHVYNATLTDCSATKTTITSKDDSWRVGAFIGTVNTKAVFNNTKETETSLTMENAGDSQNKNGAISKLFGRSFEQGVTIDGGNALIIS